jgi:dihydrodipicolinate synthase/N-acetylneuraminate lyase
MTDTIRDSVSLRGAAYQLDEDHLRGFIAAARNAQPNLALQYAAMLMEEQRDQINALQNRCEELEAKVMKLAERPASPPAQVTTTSPTGEVVRRRPGRPSKAEVAAREAAKAEAEAAPEIPEPEPASEPPSKDTAP